MSEKLLPCPFCGGEIQEKDINPSDTREGFDVSCECGASMYAWRREDAIHDWNRRNAGQASRTPPPATKRFVDYLRTMSQPGMPEITILPVMAERILAEWPEDSRSRPDAAGEGIDG